MSASIYDSVKEAKDLARELGVPEHRWGLIDNYLCDAFYAGQRDALVDDLRPAIVASIRKLRGAL